MCLHEQAWTYKGIEYFQLFLDSQFNECKLV